uniref:Uncharacterized protein n=1 Tax=Anguilla anguilla TaxID=7936 RepID=A0A0E9SH36_ANGAN
MSGVQPISLITLCSSHPLD